MNKEAQAQWVILLTAVAEAIQALGQVPSGRLYAQLMGKLSLEQYNHIINALKSTGLVTEKNYMLTWVGETT